MRKPAVLALAITLAAVACTPMPRRFTLLEKKRTSPHQPLCAYHVTRETAEGFDLEALWKGRSPNPDPAMRGGRICYQRSAAALAAARGRTPETIDLPDMNATVTIGNSGYVVYVTGRVVFAK